MVFAGSKSVAVVGCGVFGGVAAIRLAELGHRVTIFERAEVILSGASFNNQNRLHLGFHYPRDNETALQCIRGFREFHKKFTPCVVDNFESAYFIASDGSVTTAHDYLNFCRKLNLSFQQIAPANFEPTVRNVAIGVLCSEAVYDCNILRDLISAEFNIKSIKVHLGANINEIKKVPDGFRLTTKNNNEIFDAVVNCTYADLNRLTHQLGHPVPVLQHEYTIVPILEWSVPPIGITIMDGPFMSVLPFGKTGQFLLYHVERSVMQRSVNPQMPQSWLDTATAPSSSVDVKNLCTAMLADCSQFIPALASARCVAFLEGPRVVLPNMDSTDARPSIIQEPEAGYVTALSGKVDHCIWAADEIAQRLA